MAENKKPLTDSPSAPHMPTPWKVGTFSGSIDDHPCEALSIWPSFAEEGIVGPHVCLIAPLGKMSAIDVANAEFIVRAANSHEELLDACQQADLQIEYMQSKFKETGSGNAVRQQLQRAIKKAESGG